MTKVIVARATFYHPIYDAVYRMVIGLIDKPMIVETQSLSFAHFMIIKDDSDYKITVQQFQHAQLFIGLSYKERSQQSLWDIKVTLADPESLTQIKDIICNYLNSNIQPHPC